MAPELDEERRQSSGQPPPDMNMACSPQCEASNRTVTALVLTDNIAVSSRGKVVKNICVNVLADKSTGTVTQ